jgi:hypothetical protein
MNDEELTGPSRGAWQLIFFLLLVALLVGFAIAPYLLARDEARAAAHTVNWADLKDDGSWPGSSPAPGSP